MLKKKIDKFTSSLMLMVAMMSILLVASYSWFSSFYAVQNITGLFFYELNVTIYEATETMDPLIKAQPISTNEAIATVTPHEFVITTTGDAPFSYYVIIKDVTDPLLEKINPASVHYAVTVNSSPSYSVGTLSPNSAKRELVFQSTLAGNSQDTVEVILWLGPAATADGAASTTDPATGIRTYKYFEAQIIIEAD